MGILDPSENARRENWRRRVDLATAYRAFEKLSLNEGVCNHLSMIAPAANGSDENVMLIVPYGLHWSEVCERGQKAAKTCCVIASVWPGTTSGQSKCHSTFGLILPQKEQK